MKIYDHIIKGIEGYQTSGKELNTYLSSLRLYVKQLRVAYRRSPVNVDYSLEKIQSAYLITYFPHYYQLINKILQEQKLSVFQDKETLVITFIGGGPGSEAFGALKYILEHLPNVKYISVNILDINADTWCYSHEIVKNKLINNLYEDNFLKISWSASFIDLTAKETIIANKDILKKSDLLVVQNCINEIGSSYYDILQQNIEYVYQLLPKTGAFLMVDLTSSVRTVLKKLEHALVKKFSPFDIMSTLDNVSPSSMVSLNAYPSPQVRKYVLTGADGLIPRKHLKYDYSLIHKGDAALVTREISDSMLSTLYGPLNKENLSAIKDINDKIYIGIDFGTSVSVASIAYVKDGNVIIESLKLPQKDHNGSIDTSPLLPSTIGIYNNQYMVGKHAALNLANLKLSKNAWTLFKNDLGGLKSLKYPESILFDHPQKTIRNGREALVEYFKYFHESINETLSNKGLSALPVFCWSVPADYSYIKKQELISCAQDAGFDMKNVSLIEEPIAALLNFIHENNRDIISDKQKILIADLGAGTFDISILEINRDTDNINSKLLATKRINKVGGNLVNDLMVNELKKKHSSSKNLFHHCEKLKRKICNNIQTNKSIAYALPEFVDSNIDISVPIDNSIETCSMPYLDFTAIMKDYWSGNNGENLKNTLKDGLADAKLKTKDIDLLILTGGGFRNPYIQSYMSSFFSDAQLIISDNIQEQVSRGNALQSLVHNVFGKSIINPILHHDVILQIEDKDDEVLFIKGESCPTIEESIKAPIDKKIRLSYSNTIFVFNWENQQGNDLTIFIDNNLDINVELISADEIINITPKISNI